MTRRTRLGPPGMSMGGPQRTTVQRTVPRLGTGWIIVPPLADRVLRQGERIDPSHLARLEERWRELGLEGATSLRPVTHDDLDVASDRDPKVLVCEDEGLIANVRLRLRGRLLLFGMPLIDRTDALVGGARGVRGSEVRIEVAGLLCGDDRLHAVVAAGKHRRLGAPAEQLAIAQETDGPPGGYLPAPCGRLL